MTSPHYYVVDSNTIFDLHQADLLEFVFQLPCRFIISDFIIHELREPPFHRLSSMGLLVESIDPEGIAEISGLMEEYEKPSYADLSVLVLAKSRKTILISGDEDLRHAAISKGVDCYGTCWLINYLADQSVITYAQAIASYNLMRKRRRNPPADECRNLLSRWKERRRMLD